MDPTDNGWISLGRYDASSFLKVVPKKPGLYKLTFTLCGRTYAYIGEAGDMQRRICEYRKPTQGNKIEHLMCDLLTKAGSVELSIGFVGLKPSQDRRKAETRAIAKARQEGLACLNRGRDDDNWMKQYRLESEEKMLVNDLKRVRAKLARLHAVNSQ